VVIYIISQSDYNDRDRERYGIKYFSSKGYSVVVLSVQDYTNPELRDKPKPTYTQDVNAHIHYCNNFSQIKDFIDKYGVGVAFTYLSDNYQSITIRKYLRKKNIKIGIVLEGMLPSVYSNKNKIQKIKDKCKNLQFKAFIGLIIRKLYAKVFDIKYYDFLLTNNYETALENYSFQKPIKVIDIHAFDYELCLNNSDVKNIVKNKYVVFVDQNLLNHTDFVRMNNEVNINEEKYFKELNSFFDFIEKKFCFSVVIAAHPRADTSKYKKKFHNREVFVNKTVQLVKFSEFIITHYSTAINFAVIYEKPIIFLTNDELKYTFIDKIVQKFAIVLNQVYLNISQIDKKYSLKNIAVSVNEYKTYKYKYIAKNDSKMNNFEYFDNIYLRNLQ